MFNYFKKAAIENRAGDELLYEYVLTEMESDVMLKGIWAKALANSAGDTANAKSIYMQYRVQSIKDAFTTLQIVYDDLSKPKLFKYIESKILPMSSDYTSILAIQSREKEESYTVNAAEEALYEEVASELANGERKEGLWLKAMQVASGEEQKTKALYVEYRAKAIVSEKQQIFEKKQRSQQDAKRQREKMK